MKSRRKGHPPEFTPFARLSVHPLFRLLLFLHRHPVLRARTAAPRAGVDDVSQQLLVKICVVEDFWILLLLTLPDFRKLFLPANPAYMNRL